MSKIGIFASKFEVEKFNGKEIWFMTKEGEGVVGAIWSSQDLAGKVSKNLHIRQMRIGRG